MSVTIQDNFDTAAAKPTDARYGPYANLTAAKAAIPQVFRYEGLTVGIGTPVQEYWWANGVTDVDLVQKTATGNVTGITQGVGIIVDNTNPQIPDVSVDTSYVQVVSNLSTSVPTDGTSDVKYPSVKAVKDYADGLVVGLLNDRGNWAASASSPGSYPTNPPAVGSGPAGAILKGDIWFINVAGYLGTTYVSVGASVRALVDSPSPSTSTDWDIIDAGLGFTPENIANKVTSGANVNADPTSTVKYPSVRALVEYVQTYAPAPTTPNLQAVTNVGASTTNSIAAQAFGFYDSSTLSYAALSCDTTGSPSRILIEDSYASPRLSLDTAGTDLTVWTNTGSTQAVLEFGSLSGNQTYTFPNATGTVALVSNITTALSGYVPYSGATGSVNLGVYNLTATKLLVPDGVYGNWSIYGNTIISSEPYFTIEDGKNNPRVLISGIQGSSGFENAIIVQGSAGSSTQKSKLLFTTSVTDYTYTFPNATGTLLTTVATSAGNLITGTDGKVTIPDAGLSTTGLVSAGTQTFGGTKTFNDTTSFSSNVGIGTSSPSSSAKLQIDSTTQGFLLPRMTTAQMNAIVSPQIGLMIFNTDTGYVTVYRGPSFSPEWWRLEYYCEDC